MVNSVIILDDSDYKAETIKQYINSIDKHISVTRFADARSFVDYIMDLKEKNADLTSTLLFLDWNFPRDITVSSYPERACGKRVLVILRHRHIELKTIIVSSDGVDTKEHDVEGSILFDGSVDMQEIFRHYINKYM